MPSTRLERIVKGTLSDMMEVPPWQWPPDDHDFGHHWCPFARLQKLLLPHSELKLRLLTFGNVITSWLGKRRRWQDFVLNVAT